MEKEEFYYTGKGVLAELDRIGTIEANFTLEDLKKCILDCCITWQRGTPTTMINYDYRNKKS